MNLQASCISIETMITINTTKATRENEVFDTMHTILLYSYWDFRFFFSRAKLIQIALTTILNFANDGAKVT